MGEGIRLWDVSTGQESRRFGEEHSWPGCLALSPDGQTLAAAGWGEGGLRLWDVRTGREVGPCGGHSGAVQAVAWTPDGRVLSAGDFSRPFRQWDPATGKEIRRWGESWQGVESLALSPDGQTLAATSYNWVFPLSGEGKRAGSQSPPRCVIQPATPSTGEAAMSWKVRTRRSRSAGTSRGTKYPIFPGWTPP